MEVLVGTAFTIEVASHSPPPLPLPLPLSPSHERQQQQAAKAPSLFLNDEKDEEKSGSDLNQVGSDYSSDSSSSIGAPDDSDDEEEEEEEINSDVVSSKNKAFDSLHSLEESLPVKRGLSNYFNGKSKSYVDLSEVNLVSEVKELEKPENPFNKRRRILIANKYWSTTRRNKKSNFYSWSNPKSMPLLTLIEDDDDHEQDEEEEENSSSSEKLQHQKEEEEEKEKETSKGMTSKLEDRKFKASFKYYQSCLDLHELQEHQEY